MAQGAHGEGERVTLVVYAELGPEGRAGRERAEQSLMACLGSLSKSRGQDTEVVCVSDRDLGFGGKLVHRERGGQGDLGARLDRAARSCTGEVLIFLPHDSRLLGEIGTVARLMARESGWGWCELAAPKCRRPRLAKALNLAARTSGLPQPEHPLVVSRPLLAAVGGIGGGVASPLRELGVRLRARGAPASGLSLARSTQEAFLFGTPREVLRRLPGWLGDVLRRWWFP